MSYGALRVGSGTHASRLLGYCPDCGLYHGSGPARAACLQLITAAPETPAEVAAWSALKTAIELEQSVRITRTVGAA